MKAIQKSSDLNFYDSDRIINYFTKIIGSNRENTACSIKHARYAEDLALKSIAHALSAIKLFRNGFKLTLDENDYYGCDFSGIHVLVRSCIESYLVFHWIFIDKEDADEEELRCLLWIIYGISIRLKFSEFVPSERRRGAEDYLESLKQRIKDNPRFKSLSKAQQKKLLLQLRKLHVLDHLGIHCFNLQVFKAEECTNFIITYASMHILEI